MDKKETVYVMRKRRHRGHTHNKGLYGRRKYKAWAIVIVITLSAFALSRIEPFMSLGISSLIIAVVLGAFFGNVSYGATFLLKKTGVLTTSTKQILRLGIVLYGFRITFSDIAFVGVNGVLFSFFIVFSTFFFGIIVGKFLGLDRKSSVLISAGSSICGAAAVLATESMVKGGSQKVALAVCTVVVYGTIAMFAYPICYKLGIFDLDLKHMGYLMGGTLHEVAHAVAAGDAVGGDAVSASVIIKMMRVLMLVPFLVMIGIFSSFFSGSKTKGKLSNNIPYFALMFLVMVVVSSVIPTNIKDFILPTINFIDNFLLSIAMVALGITIRKDVLKNAGVKPFLLAFILAAWLLGAGYIVVRFFI